MRKLLVFAAALALMLSVRGVAASGLRVDVAIWQFSRDYPGAEPTDSFLPIQTVYIKTHDGTDWMSTYDSSPAAVSGPDQLRNLISIYRSQGIDVVAWFVPVGLDVETQVRMAEQVVDTGVTALYADVEPFAGFCYLDCDFLAQNVWWRVHNERPNARLGVMYDPRPQWVGPSAVPKWLAVAQDALPSCYWETFSGQVPWGDPAGCITQAHSDLAQLAPVRPISYVPMLQGDTTADRFRQGLDAAFSVGSPRVSVWRRGVVPAEVWDAIRNYTPPVLPPPCSQTLGDGCLLEEASSPAIYLMEGGARFHIPDPETFQRMGLNPSSIEVVPDGFMAAVPSIPRDGALLREETNPPIDVVYGGARFWIPDPATFSALGFDPAALRIIPLAGFAQIPLVPAGYTRFRELTAVTQYAVIGAGRVALDQPMLTQLLAAGKGQPLYVVPDGGLTQVPLTAVHKGDTGCDGNIDAVDALLVLRGAVGLPNLGLCAGSAGNINCDGALNSVDALLILRYVAALPVALPVGCPAIGT